MDSEVTFSTQLLTTFFVNVIVSTSFLTNKVVKLTRKYCKNIGGGGKNGMALENRLKEHRARLGINQHEMGKLAGVSRQTISLIERGDYSPSVTLALKLAHICQVTVEDIFSYSEEDE